MRKTNKMSHKIIRQISWTFRFINLLQHKYIYNWPESSDNNYLTTKKKYSLSLTHIFKQAWLSWLHSQSWRKSIDKIKPSISWSCPSLPPQFHLWSSAQMPHKRFLVSKSICLQSFLTCCTQCTCTEGHWYDQQKPVCPLKCPGNPTMWVLSAPSPSHHHWDSLPGNAYIILWS